MKRSLFLISYFSIFVCMVSCSDVELYERLQNIKNAAWDTKQVTSFPFDITDTVKPYNVFVVLRHTNLYPYRNIWLNVGLQQQDDTLRYQKFELQLAATDHWLGTGMDDIYERRALLFPNPVQFSKAGSVLFTVQHIMRQDPLPGVLQAGIRVEPAR